MEFIVSILHYSNEAFIFYLPVFIANLLIYLNFTIIGFDIPFDLHKKIHRKRIIGDGRSIAGFFFFISISMIVTLLQKRPPLEGFYLGAGGVFGCVIGSFIKRRLNLKQGDYSFFIDQTDFILWSSLFYISNFNLKKEIFITGIILALILHHIVNLFRNLWENKLIWKVTLKQKRE